MNANALNMAINSDFTWSVRKLHIALVRLRHSLSANYFLFCSGYFSTLGCGFWLLPLPFALCLSLFLYLFFFVSAFVPSLSVVSSSVFFVFLVLLLIFVCSLLSPFLLIPLSSLSFSFFVFFLVLYFFLFVFLLFILCCFFFFFFLLILLLEVLFPSGSLSVCLLGWSFFDFVFSTTGPHPFAHAAIPERGCQDSSRQKLMNTEIYLYMKCYVMQWYIKTEMLCKAMIHKKPNDSTIYLGKL